MVVRPGSVGIAGNQLAAADVAGNLKGILFGYYLSVLIENELNQLAVLVVLVCFVPAGIIPLPGHIALCIVGELGDQAIGQLLVHQQALLIETLPHPFSESGYALRSGLRSTGSGYAC